MNPATGSMLANVFETSGSRRSDLAGEIRGDGLRRAPQGLCQRECDVRREVAELGAARRFKGDRRSAGLRKAGGDGLTEQRCEGVQRRIVSRGRSRT